MKVAGQPGDCISGAVIMGVFRQATEEMRWLGDVSIFT